jgi:Ca-activated chloride channel homolog
VGGRGSFSGVSPVLPTALALACALAALPPSSPQTAAPATAPPTAAPQAAPAPAPPGQSAGKPSPQPFGEEVEVRLVQLFVVVTGPDGAPVTGLGRDDFAVRENGVPQRIDAVLDARDRPLTLGLAIDTSASMFVKLPAVARAARSLVSELSPERDRAFVVVFGPEPRLVAATTGDLGAVADALRGLEPRGRTPLWASIGVALDELAAARGKRALVTFLDGADEDSGKAYRAALAQARGLGVPIYLIVMNNEAARTGGKEFQTRSFIARLNRMADAGGGAVYYLPTHADLEPVYQRIEEELRSYYLITYYPDVPLSAGGRRKVEVEVPGRKVQVRTLRGYLPGG